MRTAFVRLIRIASRAAYNVVEARGGWGGVTMG